MAEQCTHPSHGTLLLPQALGSKECEKKYLHKSMKWFVSKDHECPMQTGLGCQSSLDVGLSQPPSKLQESYLDAVEHIEVGPKRMGRIPMGRWRRH